MALYAESAESVVQKSSSSGTDIMYDEEPCPEYAPLARARTLPLPVGARQSIAHASFLDLLRSIAPDASRKSQNSYQAYSIDMPMSEETYSYTYSLSAASAFIDFIIVVEPLPERPGIYTFSLSMKVDAIERDLCEPINMRLTVDPSKLDFSVFLFPPKSSLPEGCLHSLRVWLHVNGIDHRLFADDDLWVGKDPDFSSISEASFAKLKGRTADTGIYQGNVGGVLVNFFIRWYRLENGLYNLTLEYEAGGAGRMLLNYCPMRLGCDPSTISFVLYSVAAKSSPPNASHRLRLWICSVPPSLAASPPGSVPYICQRIWKIETFKVGAQLDFRTISSRAIMGVPKGALVQNQSPSKSGFRGSFFGPSKA